MCTISSAELTVSTFACTIHKMHSQVVSLNLCENYNIIFYPLFCFFVSFTLSLLTCSLPVSSLTHTGVYIKMCSSEFLRRETWLRSFQHVLQYLQQRSDTHTHTHTHTYHTHSCTLAVSNKMKSTCKAYYYYSIA